MELVNSLPFPAFAFRQFDSEGNLDCVVAARGTFEHNQGGPLLLASLQEGFQWEDAYDGDPHSGVLLRQTDLTPAKLGTDITFLGGSYSPDGKPAASWLCGLRVGFVQKQLRVHGSRHWRPVIRERWAGFLAKAPKRVLTDWQLGEPQPTERVTLSWKNAYGGSIPVSENVQDGLPADVEPSNPLGCGIVNLDMGPEAVAQPAATVTAPNDVTTDWRQVSEAMGFGPISPWWSPRQRHAGTYDDVWLAERHPLLPADFDVGFWQCAPSDLIARPWLTGGEDYELINLHPRWSSAIGSLPDVRLGVHCSGDGKDERHALNLDGVHFDWREDGRVLLTWRARFPLPGASGMRLTLEQQPQKPGRRAA